MLRIITPDRRIRLTAGILGYLISMWSRHKHRGLFTSLSALMAFGFLSAPVPALAAQDLNLASTTTSVSAQTSGTINVGGHNLSVQAGSALTPAEAAALYQMVQNGHQTLILNAQGAAVGGTLSLPHTATSLDIPAGVTVLGNASTSNQFNISGAIANSGHLYLYSTNAMTASAQLTATNISNFSGGLISTVLPANLGLVNAIPHLDLSLVSAQNIFNAGSICSSGNLNIHAAASILNSTATLGGPIAAMQAAQNINLFSATGNISNSGLINSLGGNINLATTATHDLLVQNLGGTMQALMGVINARDSGFSGSTLTSLSGGDFLSQQLNIYGGSGIADISAGNLSGYLNIAAGAAHVTTHTANLELGKICVTGDPSFYNTAGSITISTPLVFSGQALAVVASGDIISAPGAGAISTQSSTSNGGDIILIAGAQFTSSAGASGGPGLSTDILTVTGASATGGKIDLTAGGVTGIDSSSALSGGNGGNITIAAFSGTAAGSGTINIPTSVGITSGGTGSGANGALNIIGGSAVTLGPINTTGGTGGGAVSVTSAAINITPALTIQDGAVTGGSLLAGAERSGSIALNGSINAAGALNVATGGTVSLAAGANDTASSASINAATDTFGAGSVLTGTTGVNLTSSSSLTVNAPSGSSATIQTSGGNISIASNSGSKINFSAGATMGVLNLNTGGTGSITVTSPIATTSISSTTTVASDSNIEFIVTRPGSQWQGFSNNGVITSSKAGGTIEVYDPSAGVAFSGSGTYQMTGAGANTILLNPNGDINLGGNNTFAPGTSGSLNILTPGSVQTGGGTQTITGGATVNISAGRTFLMATPFSMNATGASVFNIQTSKLALESSGSGGNATLTTNGGSFNITSPGDLSLNNNFYPGLCQQCQKTLVLDGGAVTVNATSKIYIDEYAGISANRAMSFNLSAASATFQNEGSVSSSAPGSGNTLSINGAGSLMIAGFGQIDQTNATPGATLIQTGTAGILTINSATDQAFLGGGAINLITPHLIMQSGSYLTTLNSTSGIYGNSAFNITSPVSNANLMIDLSGPQNVRAEIQTGSAGAINISPAGSGTLTFGFSGATTAGTLYLYTQGGTGTVSTSSVGGTTIASGFTLGTNSTISVVGAPNAGGGTNFNTGGDVQIAGSIATNGGNLAILASGNITFSGAGGYSLNTGSATGNSGSITLFAGADVTTAGPSSGSADTATTVHVTGRSYSGGSIQLGTGVSSIDTSATTGNFNGANVTLIASRGQTANSGQIILPATASIKTGGSGSGLNGSFTAIFGTQSGTQTQLGNINTTGGTGGGGNVTIANATPTISGTLSVVNGAIATGTFGAGANQYGTFSVGNIAAAGNVAVTFGRPNTIGTVSLGDISGSNISIVGSMGRLTAGNITGGGTGTAITIKPGYTGTTLGNVINDATASGTAGNITIAVNNSNNLTASAGIISANGMGNGNGGIISVSADIVKSATISANGAGIGNGGSITVTNHNSNIYTVGTQTVGGGSTGPLSATGAGTTGTITINNRVGSITLGSAAINTGTLNVNADETLTIGNTIPVAAKTTANMNFTSETVTGAGVLTATGKVTFDKPSSSNPYRIGGSFIVNADAGIVIKDSSGSNTSVQVSGTPTFNAGSGNSVIIHTTGASGLNLTLAAGSNIRNNSANSNIELNPNLGDVTVNSPSGATAQFTLNGGALLIAPRAGSNVSFETDAPSSNLKIVGGDLYVTTSGGGSQSVGSGVAITTNQSAYYRLIGGGTFKDNGSITTSGTNAYIGITGTGSMAVSGSGAVALTAGGEINVSSSAALTLSGVLAFNAGTGAAKLQGDTSLALSAASKINSTGTLTLLSPSVSLGRGSAINGAKINISSAPYGSNLNVTLPSGFGTTVNATTGINFASGAGRTVEFFNSGASAATANLSGPSTIGTNSAVVAIDPNVVVSLNAPLTVAAPTLTNNGTITSTAAISMNAAGDATINQTANGNITATSLTVRSNTGNVSITQKSIIGTISGGAAGSFATTTSSGDISVGSVTAGSNIALSATAGTISLLDGSTYNAAGSINVSGQSGVTVGGGAGLGVTLSAGSLKAGNSATSTNLTDYDTSGLSSSGQVVLQSNAGNVTVNNNATINAAGGSVALIAGGNITATGLKSTVQAGNIWFNAVNNVSLGAGTNLVAVARYTPAGTININGNIVRNFAGGNVGIDVGSIVPSYDTYLNGQVNANRIGTSSVQITPGVSVTSSTLSAPNTGYLAVTQAAAGKITIANSTITASDSGIYIDPPSGTVSLSGVTIEDFGVPLPLIPSPAPSPSPPVVVPPPGPPVATPPPSPPLIVLPPTPPAIAGSITAVDSNRGTVILSVQMPQPASQAQKIQETSTVRAAGQNGEKTTYQTFIASSPCNPYVVEGASKAMIIGESGTTFSKVRTVTAAGEAEDERFELSSGRMVVLSGKAPVLIETKAGQVRVPPQSGSVITQSSSGVVRIGGLSGSAATISNASIPTPKPVGPGDELVVADADTTDEELIPTDGVDRVAIEASVTIQTHKIVRNRFDAPVMNSRLLSLCTAPVHDPSLAHFYQQLKNNSAQSSPPASISHNRPIAYVQSSAPRALSTFGGSGFVALHCGDASFSERNGHLQLDSGALILFAKQPIVATARGVNVECAQGSVVFISATKDAVIIRDAFDRGTGGVKVQCEQHSAAITPGQEIMVTEKNADAAWLLRQSKIARRRIRSFDVGQKQMTSSEFSLASMIFAESATQLLFASSNEQHRAIAGKLAKMATCLQIVTSSHGSYATLP